MTQKRPERKPEKSSLWSQSGFSIYLNSGLSTVIELCSFWQVIFPPTPHGARDFLICKADFFFFFFKHPLHFRRRFDGFLLFGEEIN